MSIESLPGQPVRRTSSVSKSSSYVFQVLKIQQMEKRICTLANDLKLVHAAIDSPEQEKTSSEEIERLFLKHQKSGLHECYASIKASLDLLLNEAKELVRLNQRALKHKDLPPLTHLKKLKKTICEVEDEITNLSKGLLSTLKNIKPKAEDSSLPRGRSTIGRRLLQKGSGLQKFSKKVGHPTRKAAMVFKQEQVQTEGDLGSEIPHLSKKRIRIESSPQEEGFTAPISETSPLAPPLKRIAVEGDLALSIQEDRTARPDQRGAFRRTSQTIADAASMVYEVTAGTSMLSGMNLQDRCQLVSAASGAIVTAGFSRNVHQGFMGALQAGSTVARAQRIMPMIQGRAPEEVMRLIQTPEVQGALINPLPAVFPVLGPVVAIASSIANAALLVSMVAKVPSWDRYQVAASAIGTGVAAWVTLDPMTSAQAGLYSGTYGGDVVRAATAPIRWFANNPRLHAFVAKKIASFQRKNP